SPRAPLSRRLRLTHAQVHLLTPTHSTNLSPTPPSPIPTCLSVAVYTSALYWKNKLVKRSKMTNLQFIPDALDRKGLLSALRAFKKGDFSVRLPMDLIGIDGEIAQVFNEVVEVNEKVTDEFARIRDEVGREG